MKARKSIAAAALAVDLVACGKPPKPELHIYTWTDYVSPVLIQKFEAKYGCTVVILDSATLKRGQLLIGFEDDATLALYNKAWNRIKAGR